MGDYPHPYCLHETDWGAIMEAVKTIKANLDGILICQGELKRLIADSQQTLAIHEQKVNDLPKPSAIRTYALIGGAVGAAFVFGLSKLL